ncbi:MAG: hypothetical protein ACRDFQ_04315 [Anaerolineales bacterium]
MLDDSDLQFPEQTPAPAPRRSGNRSFLVVAGILGAILLLSLVGIAVYALVILPAQQAQEPVVSSAQQTQTAVALALQVTLTSTNTATTAPTVTRTPTRTFTPSSTPATIDPATATVNALLTSAALAQTQAANSTAPTATSGPTATVSSLPQSGFAEDAGVPGLLALTAILLLIIFTARRVRTQT